ncbi:MAG: hypothetical protein RLZZ428_20, partial [Pseudomonadota bacterium]
MKIQNQCTILCATLLFASAMYANDTTVPKYAIKSNYEILYTHSPKKVESFMEMLEEGTLYGRLRSNTFMYQWEKEIDQKQQNHLTSGLGGSLIYKSASLYNLDFTTGFYYTYGFTDIASEDAA